MPLDDALRAHTGDDAFADGSAMLTDPALAELREWAGGAGQRWQLISYVRHLPFWSGLLGDRLDELLAYDYPDYDLFDVGARFGSLGLDGPRTSTQLAIWLAVAGAGLVLASAPAAASRTHRRRRGGRRRRPRSTSTCPSSATPWRCSATSSPRSPGCRSPSSWPWASGSRRSPTAAAPAVSATSTTRRRRRRGGGCRGRVAATGRCHDRRPRHDRARHDDRARRVLRQRAARPGLRPAVHEGADRPRGALGVTYYEGALHNKGPFEPFVYRAAAFLTSDDGFWLGISAFVVVAAAALRRRRGHDGSRRGRVTPRRRRGRRRHVRPPRAVTRRLLGRAVQPQHHRRRPRHRLDDRSSSRGRGRVRRAVGSSRSVSSGCCSVSACRRSSRRSSRRPSSPPSCSPASAGSAGPSGAEWPSCWSDAPRLTVLAPFAWYGARGRFAEFWGGWWIYGSYQSAGLGRSLFGQFGLAWDQAYAYYRTWPLSALALVAAVGLAVVRWPQLGPAQRALRLGIGAVGRRRLDRAGARPALLVALLLGPRPADVAGHGDGGCRPRRARARPPRETGAAGRRAGPRRARRAVHEHRGRAAATASPRRRASPGSTTSRRPAVPTSRARSARSGRPSTSSAGAGDPLLAWTERPWTYLQWDRIAATRYVWGSFLLGQIYLGAAGPQFVPPHTAEWFADDLARTDPQVFVEEVEHPVPPDSLVGQRRGRRLHARVRRAHRACVHAPRAPPPSCSNRRRRTTWEPEGAAAPGWVAGDGEPSSTSADRRPGRAQRRVPAPRRGDRLAARRRDAVRRRRRQWAGDDRRAPVPVDDG